MLAFVADTMDEIELPSPSSLSFAYLNALILWKGTTNDVNLANQVLFNVH